MACEFIEIPDSIQKGIESIINYVKAVEAENRELKKQFEIIGLSISYLETSVASLQRRIGQLEEGGLVEEPVDLSQVPTFLGGTKKVLKGLEQNPALESIQESVARFNSKSSSMSFSEFVEENVKTLEEES